MSIAFRLRRVREVSAILPRIFSSGIVTREMFPASYAIPLNTKRAKRNESAIARECQVCWCSTVSIAPHEFSPELNFLSFVQSTLNELEGPQHFWVNKIEESKEPFNRDGIFLVICDAFLEDFVPVDCDRIPMIERIKLLQQRFMELFSNLNILGFQHCTSVSSVAAQAGIIHTIMRENITFPILLSNKNFPEMVKGACYLLFEGFRGPVLYHEKNVELGRMVKVIEELNISQKTNALMVENLKFTGMRQPVVIKEPQVCSFRNLLLYFPGCISVDEDGDRLFLSDTNHHRIIITDSNGKILDCIGSFPGFEDGDFSSAKLLRPAASFYRDDCLYFVDSENHAIRRADLKTRMLETLYPICDSQNRGGSLWSWILNKLGILKEPEDADIKIEEFSVDSLAFPWHLMKSGESDLLITNKCFETLWIMNISNGEIKDVVKGSQNIMEICGEIIGEKVSLLEEVFGKELEQRVDPGGPLKGLSHAGLISSFTTYRNNLVFCDTARQRVLKCNRGSKDISNLQFSNFGILGLPYWLSCPVESVICGDPYERPRNNHLQYFNVLPGRCDIQVHVTIPEGTQLASQLEEGCIWRQARGSAVEVSGSEAVATSSEKVGVSQQWFDELDNLAFSNSGVESRDQDEEKIPDRNSQDDNVVVIDSTVNISPGTSEVVIYTVLYLKLNEKQSSLSRLQDMNTIEKVLDFSNNDRSRKQGGNACCILLLESCRDLRDIVFMKPLHLRIRLDCDDHPKSYTSKDIILTDSSIQVNVSLE